MSRKLFILLLTVTLLLSACNLPVASGAGTHAWIDAPLDGMHLLAQPYSIIFHGSDPHGITRMEVSVNGQVLATLPNPETTKPLIYLTQVWTPQEPGRYIIRVRAQNTAGAWSEQDLVTVEVAGAATPTPTLVASLTLTPTSTPSSTPTSTLTAMAGFTFSNTSSPKQVYHGVCTPNQVLFAVAVTPPQNVQDVTVFTRLEDANGATRSAWDQGTAMKAQGNGIFQRSLPTSALPGLGQVNAGLLDYQFVATDAIGTILARSPVYNDIQLGPCGFVFKLPNIHLFQSTPTNTLQKVK
jgi:hypothetical protein